MKMVCSSLAFLQMVKGRKMSPHINGSELVARPAMHSVMLNLANKFSQCTFGVAEHYDLFSGLIILVKRQA